MSNIFSNTGDKVFDKNKWTYSLGGIGRDLAYSLYTYFLLTFILYTKQITDAQFALIGVIIVVCRIWDGINDPIMGGIIENTRTKFGKFKPWILIGCITNSIVLVLIYSLPLDGTPFVIAFTFLYLLWDLTYTMNDIGYWSMLPSLTSDPGKRDILTSSANLWAGLGTILANGLVPLFTVGSMAIGGNAITGYRTVSIIIALCFIGCQALTCVGVKEHHIANVPLEERVGFKKMIRIIFNNKQVLWTALILLFVNLSGALLTAFGTNYIYLSFGYEGSYASIFVIFYGASSAISYLLYPALAKKFSRMGMVRISFALTAIGYACFFLTGTLLSGTASFALLCFESLFIGLGYSFFLLVSAVCLSNTIEYNEYMTGNRDEAIIFSVRPFMSKMSASLQQIIITCVYLIIGIKGITDRISDAENYAINNQEAFGGLTKEEYISEILAGADDSMTFALRLVMAVLPVLFMGIAFIIIRNKYTIDEKEYDRILAELEARHAADNK